MEFKERTLKRSFTDCFKSGDPAQALHGFRFTRKTTLNYNENDSRNPVYTPGPRPSELLKKFVSKKEPMKLNRIDQIRMSLTGFQRSLTFKIRTDKSRINSMNILRPEIIKE
jgi:hypothetical protein